ncbi:unnamed protein product [Notodromas monacha]|uniref:Uncharacterized protein n=1 Tax=Notodromas monacha TaxID=399045 RepID=A0A7R9BCE7_9CRUS|nr:unnamed protein product [Notodromas monacha]CAG0912705.1 unnamed protein product [Notodromas monacha]
MHQHRLERGSRGDFRDAKPDLFRPRRRRVGKNGDYLVDVTRAVMWGSCPGLIISVEQHDVYASSRLDAECLLIIASVNHACGSEMLPKESRIPGPDAVRDRDAVSDGAASGAGPRRRATQAGLVSAAVSHPLCPKSRCRRPDPLARVMKACWRPCPHDGGDGAPRFCMGDDRRPSFVGDRKEKENGVAISRRQSDCPPRSPTRPTQPTH